MDDHDQVTLLSQDGQRFVVSKGAAYLSETVKNLLEDTGDAAVVPLPNVRGAVLSKVNEYCKFHVDATATTDGKKAVSEEDVAGWDKDYVKVDKETLFDLILAANYLNIPGLLDLTCQAVADMIKGKSPEEIRKELNIENDFSPAEEEEVRRENQWAFD